MSGTCYEVSETCCWLKVFFDPTEIHPTSYALKSNSDQWAYSPHMYRIQTCVEYLNAEENLNFEGLGHPKAWQHKLDKPEQQKRNQNLLWNS